MVKPETRPACAVRELIEQDGAFTEIHVSTLSDICESCDRKRLYANVRKGLAHEFTVIGDFYEAPEDPEIHTDTTDLTLHMQRKRVSCILIHIKKDIWTARRP